jgi:hypothetical protein
MRLLAKTRSIVTIAFIASPAFSQNVTISPLDGTTPGINTPGSPIGSYN